ncbi:Ornithine carbamoyltransferase [Gammaproteobacteria bacterium]
MATRHFLTLLDLRLEEATRLLERASELKVWRNSGIRHKPFEGKVLAMLFEKASTRTRVSFEAAMAQCGGNAIFLSPRDIQIGRGESIEDSARVLSSMVDAIMIRTFAHDRVELFSAYSSVPVINALTDRFHPCQLLADMQTFQEHRGSIAGKTVAWIGDGNNMCNTYLQAAQLFGFHLRIACPVGYEPSPELLAQTGEYVSLVRDPMEAASGAHLVTTDVWTSMGQESEQNARKEAFSRYQVNESVMLVAANDAIFMHCLPAHRGEEVSAEVIDGLQSVVWQQAENRLHSQKALLEWFFN